MRAIVLDKFGVENLRLVDLEKPAISPDEVLVRFQAASINSRDYQIITGGFSPELPLPIIPVSDGAGEIVETGANVADLAVGDMVCPLFFPEWLTGEALRDERSVSSGLEAPGVLREYGAYRPHQLIKIPAYLSPAEAACLPCAGLTAWTALMDFSALKSGDWVLLQGTGGVSLLGLQLAKAAGAQVIITSGHDAKLAKTKELGADYQINYRTDTNWGATAKQISDDLGVHAVLEVGGTGTLQQSIAALRRGGHINIIGYFAGIELGLNVFHLIERNAHIHGLSVGHRDAFAAMLAFMEQHQIRPAGAIGEVYEFENAPEAIAAIARGEHYGKIVVDFD